MLRQNERESILKFFWILGDDQDIFCRLHEYKMNHEKRANNKDVLAEAGVEETSAVKKRQCIGPSAKASIEKASWPNVSS